MHGFLGNFGEVGSLNTEREDATRFLAAWHALGKDPMESRDLLKLVEFGAPLHDDLPEELQIRGLDARRLGVWLAKRQGSRYGDLRLVRTEGRSHSRLWSVTGR